MTQSTDDFLLDIKSRFGVIREIGKHCKDLSCSQKHDLVAFLIKF